MSRWWNWSRETLAKRSLVVLTALTAVIGFSVATVAVQASAVAPAAVTASTGASAAAPAITESSPHPGYLVVHEVAPGGATTEDPAISYDTVSSEPIFNTYETLIAYNGSTTATFSPVLSTCVPGTVQCTDDYGTEVTGNGSYANTGFTGVFNQTGAIFNGANGEPIYWTFPIDPNAKFYDPSGSSSGFGVYPSDVMFSIARTLLFADLPSPYTTSGWILAQSLLPIGNGSFDFSPTADAPMHFPYNNTPYNILSSMLVNNSTYCPATAISEGHGCITFVADGSAQDWPQFLQFLSDPLGGAVEPCGWFTANSAGLPGFPGAPAGPAYPDGSCGLPGSSYNLTSHVYTSVATSTDSAAFQSFLNSPSLGSKATYWDGTEILALDYPTVQGHVVESNLVGSGPYSAAVSLSSGYALVASPAYAEPIGCTGGTVNGQTYAAYVHAYCDPAPGSYIHQVNVTYDPDDTNSISGFGSGTIDVGAILAPQTLTNTIPLKNSGKLTYTEIPTIGNFFFSPNLYYNDSVYNSTSLFSGEPAQNIPQNFFASETARMFLTSTYPYTTIENTINTVGGLQYFFNAGGPIPAYMGDYYPGALSENDGCTIGPGQGCNVSFPDANPSDNAAIPGTPAWWWAVGTNPSSPYYDAQLAHCEIVTCKFIIAGEQGAVTLNAGLKLWIDEIENFSGNALQPTEFDMSFTDLIVYLDEAAPADNPIPVWNLGWAPDYPDPTDYLAAYASPGGGYFAANAVNQQLLNTSNAGTTAAFDNLASCVAFSGHGGGNVSHQGEVYGNSTPSTWANFSYWAWGSNNTSIPTVCQGVALSAAIQYGDLAGPLGANNVNRTLYYSGEMSILNKLGFYVWVGQQNEFPDTAPWINNASLNINPTIGGSQNQLWFHINYTSYTPLTTKTVTFKEVDLPAGQNWNVTLDGALELNHTIPSGAKSAGTLVFSEPAGAATLAIGAPAGYGAAKITGSGNPNQTTATISANVTWTITFGENKSLNFVAQTKNFMLANDSNWTVTLKPSLSHGGPAEISESATTNYTNATDNGTNISFSIPVGAAYKFTISGYPSSYKPAPASGAASVPATPSKTYLKKIVKFKLDTSTIKFDEADLSTHDRSWNVEITASNNNAIMAGYNVTSAAATISLKLPTGSYTWVATSTGYTTQTGNLTVTYPTAQTVHVTF
jgi:hypothetical protein